MDVTDLRILREVFIGDSESFRSDRVAIETIAERLSLHRNTVSQRLKRLTEHGVYLPPSLDVEPGQFGVVAGLVHLDVPPERRDEKMREAVFATPGVQVVLPFVDGWGVIAFADDTAALASTFERIRAFTGATRMEDHLRSDRDYPPVEPARFTALDAEIMIALLADSRAPFPELAERLGTTSMTAQRRYERMREDGILYVLPGPSPSLEGVVLAYVVADIPRSETEDATKAELQKRLPDAIVRNLAPKGRAHFILFASALDEIEGMAHEARRVPGVAGVHLRVMTGMYTNPRHAAWIAQRIRARVRQ